MTEWGASSDVRLAWFSLEENDNTPARFFRYVMAALEKQGLTFPEELFHNTAYVSEAMLSQMLCVLEQEVEPPYLVLDDYHFIDNPDIHDSVCFLIDHWPMTSHLFVATRHVPPFPLGLWQVRDTVKLVDGNSLRFSLHEAQSFFFTTMGLSIEREECEKLHQQTEGWAAGLQMMALSHSQHSTFPSRSFRSQRLFVQYMLTELLERQHEALRSFLLQTSILKRLDVELCQWLTENEEAGTLLEQLVNTHMFLVPLDSSHQWFRYHHLFSKALAEHFQQQDTTSFRELHRKAMRWFEQQGLWEDAAYHALQMEDWEQAARLLENVLRPLWMEGQNWSILQWLEPLPEEWLLQRPLLGIFWSSAKAGRSGVSPDVMTKLAELELHIQDAMEQQHDEVSSQTWNELLLSCRYIRMELSWLANDPDQALELIATIRAEERQSKWFPQAYSHLIEGMVLDMIGAPLQAVQSCYQVTVDECQDEFFGMGTYVYAVWGLAWSEFENMEVENARQRCWRLLDRYKKTPPERRPAAFHLSPIYTMLAHISLEQGDLEQAQHLLSQGLSHMSKNLVRGVHLYVHLIASFVAMLAGRYQEAEEAIKKAQPHNGGGSPREDTEVVQALLALSQERWSDVLRWDQSCQFSMEEAPVKRWLASYHLHTAVLLSQEQFVEATEWLRWLESLTQSLGRKRIQLETVLWNVSLSVLQGHMQDAIEHLHEALVLAEPGATFLFLQHKDTLVPLVEHLAREADSSPLPSLAGWEPLKVALLAEGVERQKEAEDKSKPLQEAETCKEEIPVLSPRELEIVTLASKGQTNREIGASLHVSSETVKSHMKNIFIKLEVRSRAQAVAKAQQLKLL